MTTFLTANGLWVWPVIGVLLSLFARALAEPEPSIDTLAVGVGLAVTAVMAMPAVLVERWTQLSATAAARNSQPSADALGSLMLVLFVMFLLLLGCIGYEKLWGRQARQQTPKDQASRINQWVVGVFCPMLIGAAAIYILVAAASVSL